MHARQRGGLASHGRHSSPRPLPQWLSTAPRAGTPYYSCTVYNPGVVLTPVEYKIAVSYVTKGTQQVPEEQAFVKQLFDRCCNGEGLCQQWKLANDALKPANGVREMGGWGRLLAVRW